MAKALLDKVGGMNFGGGQIPEDISATYLQRKTQSKELGYTHLSSSYSDCDSIDLAKSAWNT